VCILHSVKNKELYPECHNNKSTANVEEPKKNCLLVQLQDNLLHEL